MTRTERSALSAGAGTPVATVDGGGAGRRRETAGFAALEEVAFDGRLHAWRAFLEAHARVSRRLDDELRTAHGISLAEYDALVQLVEAPDHRLRMNQLADRVLLSRSGVTRLIDRLVADGLVTRSACTTDARGAEAVLTAQGRSTLRAAAPTHLRGIRRYFVESIEPGDLETVARSLGAVARGACAGVDATRGPGCFEPVTRRTPDA
jgi:DNA-binding MarR family transcriptional regulator